MPDTGVLSNTGVVSTEMVGTDMPTTALRTALGTAPVTPARVMDPELPAPQHTEMLTIDAGRVSDLSADKVMAWFVPYAKAIAELKKFGKTHFIGQKWETANRRGNAEWYKGGRTPEDLAYGKSLYDVVAEAQEAFEAAMHGVSTSDESTSDESILQETANALGLVSTRLKADDRLGGSRVLEVVQEALTEVAPPVDGPEMEATLLRAALNHLLLAGRVSVRNANDLLQRACQ